MKAKYEVQYLNDTKRWCSSGINHRYKDKDHQVDFARRNTDDTITYRVVKKQGNKIIEVVYPKKGK